VPISLLTVIGGLIFWAAGLAKEVQANATEIERMRGAQSSLEAEMFQRMEHATAVMSEIQVSIAKTDAKVELLVEYAKEERRKGNNH
jgi:hypothetical protein